jgi:hypothetical protein
MFYRRLLFLVILLAASRIWAGDPRLEKDEVRGCFESAQRERVASYDRREAGQILDLLKKCE